MQIRNPCRLLVIAIVFLLYSVPAYSQDVPKEALASITPEEMYAHVAFLASDSLKGRRTPSPELELAAEYIAKEFASYGLKPVGKDSSYFQYFNVLEVKLAQPNTLTLTTAQGETTYEIKQHYVPYYFTANKKVSAPVVFAGYGITSSAHNYDDYAGIDVKDKIVLVMSHEPQEKDSTSIFDGVRATDFSRPIVKAQIALEHGAVGMLLATDPNNHRGRRPKITWASLIKGAPEGMVQYALEEKAENTLVAMNIHSDLADALLKGTGKTFSELQALIDTQLVPQSFEIPSKAITMETALASQAIPVKNVVGLLEGSDPKLKKELVVIGAHYDHIGYHKRTGEIYNGADDNASGTAGVMEVAEAFTESSMPPKRSILFVAFAGEELFLYGSRHYVNEPIFPLQQTITMLNMDMICRNDTNEVAIIGSKTSADLTKINEQQNRVIGLTLRYDQDKYFMQSDHYPFARQGIPVLFYNTKEHPDLHQPTDDVDKIIPEKMVKIGQLVFSTAWTVANRTEKPKYVK